MIILQQDISSSAI